MKHRKIIITILFFSLIILLLDYLPMLYSRQTGNGNTFVEHYQYPELSGQILLEKIVALKTMNSELQPPNDNCILGDTVANYTYIKFFDKENKEYFHTWVHIDTSDVGVKGTELIFYGVSNTPDKDEEKRINHDFDYFSRQMKIKRFETLIKTRIDNLKDS